MSTKAQSKTTIPKFPSRDAWTEAWQKHCRKAGLPGYELPASTEDDFDRGRFWRRRFNNFSN